MTDEQSAMTPWEVGRTLVRIEAAQLELTREVRARHHEISNKVNEALAPISALKARVDNVAEEVRELRPKVDRLIWVAAAVSGAISAGSWLLSRMVKL